MVLWCVAPVQGQQPWRWHSNIDGGGIGFSPQRFWSRLCYFWPYWFVQIWDTNIRVPLHNLSALSSPKHTIIRTGNCSCENRIHSHFQKYTSLEHEQLTKKMNLFSHLQKYPLDDQKCHIEINSFRHMAHEYHLGWMKDPTGVGQSNLESFNLVGQKTENCTFTFTSGTYTCSRIVFHFRRGLGYFFLQVLFFVSNLVRFCFVRPFHTFSQCDSHGVGSFMNNHRQARRPTTPICCCWFKSVLNHVTFMCFPAKEQFSMPTASPTLWSLYIFITQCPVHKWFSGLFTQHLHSHSVMDHVLDWHGHWKQGTTLDFFICLQISANLASSSCKRARSASLEQSPHFILSKDSWCLCVFLPAVPFLRYQIGLALLLVLTMTTLNFGVQQSMPKVSYIKSIDVWFLGTCFFHWFWFSEKP